LSNNTKPVIHINPNNRPEKVLCEEGKIDVDHWYYWPQRYLLGQEIGKEDYEPVRQEGIFSGTTTSALSRIAWRNKRWANLYSFTNRIEVVFMGPGYTPQVRTKNLFESIVFESYLTTHNLVREENYHTENGSPPSYYKIAGPKRHFPTVVNYGGWPPIR